MAASNRRMVFFTQFAIVKLLTLDHIVVIVVTIVVGHAVQRLKSTRTDFVQSSAGWHLPAIASIAFDGSAEFTKFQKGCFSHSMIQLQVIRGVISSG